MKLCRALLACLFFLSNKTFAAIVTQATENSFVVGHIEDDVQLNERYYLVDAYGKRKGFGVIQSIAKDGKTATARILKGRASPGWVLLHHPKKSLASNSDFENLDIDADFNAQFEKLRYRFGVGAGFFSNANSLTDSDVASVLAPSIDVGLSYMSTRLGCSAELMYFGAGFKVAAGTIRGTYQANYLALPLNAIFEVSHDSGIEFRIRAGAAPALMLNNSSSVTDNGRPVQYKSVALASTDFLLIAGGEIQLQPSSSSKMKYWIDLNFLYGLTNVNKADSDLPWKNQGFLLLGGASW